MLLCTRKCIASSLGSDITLLDARASKRLVHVHVYADLVLVVYEARSLEGLLRANEPRCSYTSFDLLFSSYTRLVRGS